MYVFGLAEMQVEKLEYFFLKIGEFFVRNNKRRLTVVVYDCHAVMIDDFRDIILKKVIRFGYQSGIMVE